MVPTTRRVIRHPDAARALRQENLADLPSCSDAIGGEAQAGNIVQDGRAGLLRCPCARDRLDRARRSADPGRARAAAAPGLACCSPFSATIPRRRRRGTRWLAQRGQVRGAAVDRRSARRGGRQRHRRAGVRDRRIRTRSGASCGRCSTDPRPRARQTQAARRTVAVLDAATEGGDRRHRHRGRADDVQRRRTQDAGRATRTR